MGTRLDFPAFMFTLVIEFVGIFKMDFRAQWMGMISYADS